MIRFGAFEVDNKARELRKNGIRIKLEDQPFQVLAALIEKPGEVVTREELQARLWPEGTFVDFEKSLTKAVNKLRTALSDSPMSPRCIETLSRRGYRFIAPLETAATQPEQADPWNWASIKALVARGNRYKHQVWMITLATLLIVLLCAAVAADWARPLEWHRLFGIRQIQSIAVLPIRNLSGDAAQDYYADGITDELINNLARIGSIRVISSTSAMRYKGANKSLPELARLLGVDGVVEGSVSRPGGRIHINVRLVQCPAERQLWAAGYDGDASDASLLQGQIALAVAHHISARVTAETSSQLASGEPVNPRAYDTYLRGRALWNQRGAEAITQAGSYFQQALREDPSFALAYSGLADRYMIGWGASIDNKRGREYARKAVDLDPGLAEAHVSLGLSDLNEFRFEEAALELRYGIALSPGSVTAHQFYTIYLLTMGRSAEALAESDLALRLDPFSLPVNNLRGYILVALREYDRAIQHLQATCELGPLEVQPRQQLARIYWMKGNAPAALAIERQLAGISHCEEFARGDAEVPSVIPATGLEAACRRSAQFNEQMLTAGDSCRISPELVMLQYGFLKDKAKVLQFLDQLIPMKRYGIPLLLNTAPELDFLRTDPAFQERLRKIRLIS